MIIAPYLFFDGNCAEAFKFYEEALRGKIEMMLTYGESPAAAEMPKDQLGRIMHVRLKLGENLLMGADSCQGACPPQGFSISLNLTDPVEAERIFPLLAEGGTVRMPLEETFWAVRFGMVADRFGTPWMVNCAKAD